MLEAEDADKGADCVDDDGDSSTFGCLPVILCDGYAPSVAAAAARAAADLGCAPTTASASCGGGGSAVDDVVYDDAYARAVDVVVSSGCVKAGWASPVLTVRGSMWVPIAAAERLPGGGAAATAAAVATEEDEEKPIDVDGGAARLTLLVDRRSFAEDGIDSDDGIDPASSADATIVGRGAPADDDRASETDDLLRRIGLGDAGGVEADELARVPASWGLLAPYEAPRQQTTAAQAEML